MHLAKLYFSSTFPILSLIFVFTFDFFIFHCSFLKVETSRATEIMIDGGG